MSRLNGYMQAVTFVRHVLQVEEVDHLTKSARCKGAATDDSVKERVQASALLVEEVKQLHSILNDDDQIWDSIFAGACLFCLYARARWGDISRSEKVLLDRDSTGTVVFIEAQVGRHKTMRAQQHKHQFLPMVAPAHGVVDGNWVETWLCKRRQMDMQFPPDGLFMHAPLFSGDPSCRPLETKECGAWLRQLLFQNKEVQRDRRVSSPSFKCTTLSWAAKRGISTDLRLQLGYHSSSFKMALVYSRDGAAPSIAALEELIREVRLQIFKPDETRSGRVSKEAGQGVETVKVAGKVEIDLESPPVIEVKDEDGEWGLVTEVVSSDSGESDDSSSTSSEEERPERMTLDRLRVPPKAPDGYKLWQHSRSGILHLTAEGNCKVFECGRPVGLLHRHEGLNPMFETPICKLCFTHAQEDLS